MGNDSVCDFYHDAKQEIAVAYRKNGKTYSFDLCIPCFVHTLHSEGHEIMAVRSLKVPAQRILSLIPPY